MKEFEFLKSVTAIVAKVSNHKAKETITTDVMKSGNLFVIVKGAVLVEYMSLPNHSDKGIADYKTTGDFIGIEHLLNESTGFHVMLSAIDDVEVMTIDRGQLSQSIADPSKSGPLLRFLLEKLTETNLRLQTQLEAQALYDCHDIMLWVLQNLARVQDRRSVRGTVVTARIPILAKLTGLSEESVRRSLKRLMKRGLLVSSGTHEYVLFD